MDLQSQPTQDRALGREEEDSEESLMELDLVGQDEDA